MLANLQAAAILLFITAPIFDFVNRNRCLPILAWHL